MPQTIPVDDITKELQEEFPELADQIPSVVATILEVQTKAFQEGVALGAQVAVKQYKKSEKFFRFISMLWAASWTILLFPVFTASLSWGIAFVIGITILVSSGLVFLFQEAINSSLSLIESYLNKEK